MDGLNRKLKSPKDRIGELEDNGRKYTQLKINI